MLNTNEKTFKDIVNTIQSQKQYRGKLPSQSDDYLFAQNEIKNIDRKFEKSKMRSMKIWEKKPLRGHEDDKSESSIKKKILEIKQNIREKGGLLPTLTTLTTPNLANLNGKLHSYTGKSSHVDIISESNRIIQEKALQSSLGIIPTKADSRNNFIIDNREISMKNFILDLLKSERTKILSKEGEVSKALRDSEGKLEDDYKRFESFTEYERSKQKEMDKILLEAGKGNRDLADKKKKLNQENKQIMDELERTVKSIRNYKGDAIFVHYVLGDLTGIKFKNDVNVLEKHFDYNDNINQKDVDYEKMTEELLAEFAYVERERKQNYIPNLLQDHTQMLQTFVEMEENILKLMDSKQNFDKETERMLIENNFVLNDFEYREKSVRKEREKLLLEKEKEDKVMKELIRSTSEEGANSEIKNMLRDLYCNTIYGADYELVSSHKRVKAAFDIKELMEHLRTMEFNVIEFIEDLDDISKEDEDKFKKIIYSRKELNKYKKQEDQKKKSEQMTNLRKEKAEERMHRIVVKGRNPMQHNIAGKGERKLNLKETLNKENDDYLNLIYADYNYND